MNVPGNARLALTVFLGLLVSSCGEVLPRFDNPLNPEIRSLRAVEVVDGVRCAVTSFLRERYDEMTTAALEKAERARCQVTHLKWNFRVMTLDQKPGSPTEGKCIIANNIEDADPINCNPVYHAWTYERYKKRDAKDDSVQLTSARNCVPNGGCVPGTVPKGNDTCTLEDDSRFALDPNSSATIELNLTANNSGSMAYTRLDAEHLGWLERYVAPGNSPPGTPFPSLTIKPKATNVVSMQIVMPQSPYIAEEKQPDHIQQNIEKVKEAIRKTTQKRAEEIERLKSLFIQQGLPRIEVPRRLDADEPVYTPQALRALQSEKNRGYEENCGRRDIDFAGLKHLLRKFVAEREDELFSRWS